MKPWSAPLLASYSSSTSTLCLCWRVVRTDSTVWGWTDHDEDLVIAGVTYHASTGLSASATQQEASLNQGTVDTSAFLDVSSEAEIEAGLWDEAVVTVFECDWQAPPAVFDPAHLNILRHGTLGQVDRRAGTFTAELRGVLAKLSTRIGRVYTTTCPWRLGDSRCQVDTGPHTRSGAVSALGTDPALSFTDSTQAEPAGFFDEGLLTMTSGANAGHAMDVRRWEGQAFALHRPLPYPVQVGDTYTAVRGDDKRATTCEQVFHNLARFGGFPHLPGIDQVLHNPLLGRVKLQEQAPPDGNPANDPARGPVPGGGT